MKDRIRDLFTYSSGERKGIITLVFILIVICSINMIPVLRQPEPITREYPGWMKDTGAYEEPGEGVFPYKGEFESVYSDRESPSAQLSAIDPNTASQEELIRAGFNWRISRTIIRYREKGGRFRTPDDLKKIYGITPGMYQAVSAHIGINDDHVPIVKPLASLPDRISLNTADSVTLEKLPGIGPVLAKRIVRYRTLLGGFYSPEQLKEVYGVTDSLFLHIGSRFEADTSMINKVNLNTSDEKYMAHHPYIGKYLAAGIVQYRLHAGKILNLNDLITNGLVPEDRFDKLKNYISL